jgi:hypothetical protein
MPVLTPLASLIPTHAHVTDVIDDSRTPCSSDLRSAYSAVYSREGRKAQGGGGVTIKPASLQKADMTPVPWMCGQGQAWLSCARASRVGEQVEKTLANSTVARQAKTAGPVWICSDPTAALLCFARHSHDRIREFGRWISPTVATDSYG